MYVHPVRPKSHRSSLQPPSPGHRAVHPAAVAAPVPLNRNRSSRTSAPISRPGYLHRRWLQNGGPVHELEDQRSVRKPVVTGRSGFVASPE
jgi:hypothetical protein